MEKVSTLGAIATLLILAGGPVGHAVRASEDKASLLSLRKGTASALHIQRSANDVPGRVLIPNVPFVSWADAAHIEIHDQFLNPSTVSALATVLKYWDQSVNLLKEADKAFPGEPGGWAVADRGKAKSLTDLKPLLERGLPVVVYTAITPYAHSVNPTAATLFAVAKHVKLKEPGPQSRILPMMAPLESFVALEAVQLHPWESLYNADRVLIGYDDARRVVTLHDGSFGPAWEIGYDDFDTMWAARGRDFMVARPADGSMRPSSSSGYAARTPDQLAATHWVMGCALAAAGRLADAEAEIKKGLTLANVGKGYRHLLLFELAVQRAARGDINEAISRSEAATELVPQDPRPWLLLAQAYRQKNRSDQNGQRAEAAQKRAEELGRCSENAQASNRFEVRVMPPEMLQESQRDLASVLAHDFYISAGCRSSIAWLLGPSR